MPSNDWLMLLGMSQNRIMDHAYARLSLLAGCFAYQADAHLGRDHFISMIRDMAWDLTPEKLAQFKAEAIAMGVPPDELVEPDAETVERLIDEGMARQAEIDAALGLHHR